MKITALFLVILISFLSQSVASASRINNDVKIKSNGDGGDTNIDINISNKDGSNNSRVESSSNTNVDIKHTGEGSSNVKINGQEWSLEGPGQVSVSNGTTTSSTPNPTAKATPTASPSSSPSPSPSAQPSSSPQVLGVSEEKHGALENMIEALGNLLAKLRSLF